MSGSANYPDLGARQRARVNARQHLIEEHGWDPFTLDRFNWSGPAQDVVDLHDQILHDEATEHSHVG
jgi:hypothetical protein